MKMVKDNPQVKFYFVSVWNNGEDGRAMLKKYEVAEQPNVTFWPIRGPRREKARSGSSPVCRFPGFPTWVYKGGDLRYARLIMAKCASRSCSSSGDDSKSEWSHKGEPSRLG